MIKKIKVSTKMLIKFMSFLLLISGSLALEGYKILEISPKSEDEANVIAALYDAYNFLQLSRVEPSLMLVSPEEYQTLSGFLEKRQVKYEIINDDVQSDVLEDATSNEQLCARSTFTTDCYRSHEEINNYLEQTQMQHPYRVSVKKAGLSYEGRELKTITITNGDGRKNKKIIFVDAGIHAREWISPSVALYIIQQLVQHSLQNKNLLYDYDWVILPVINADGYEYTRADTNNRFWRKTRKPYNECFGVDANRNFGYKFGYGVNISSDECSDYFKGPEPYSEPEIVVLRDIIKSYKGRLNFYLTLHSYGPYLVYPWVYDKIEVQNQNELQDVVQTGYNAIFKYSGRKYMIGNSAKVIYPAGGSSLDYAYSEGTRIAVTMELPGGGNRGFDPPPKDIKKYAKESWVGIVAMAKRVIEKY